MTDDQGGKGSAFIPPVPLEIGEKVQTVTPMDPRGVAFSLRGLLERAAGAQLAWWEDDYYLHRRTHWAPVRDSTVEHWLWNTLGEAVWPKPDKEGNTKPEPWRPTTKRVADVGRALSRAVVNLGEVEDEKVMALENYVLDPTTRTTLEHTPDRFNLSSLPFAYDPKATCPHWLEFLESVFLEDVEAIETLQQWFGYVLSGRKDQEKILSLTGRRRCGKGTIVRVLEAMCGPDNVVSPELDTFASHFGRESAIGKTLVTFQDVRWNIKGLATAVPLLLSIGSRDKMEINRKGRTAWRGVPAARVMLISNDVPTFKDASGALAGRMVMIDIKTSHFGREDTGLGERLMTELPGILNWALDGLDVLAKVGHFTEPGSSAQSREDMERDSNPIVGWVRDMCEIGEEKKMTVDTAWGSFREWCEEQGIAREHVGNKLAFGRKFKARYAGEDGISFPGQVRVDGVKSTWVLGIEATSAF